MRRITAYSDYKSPYAYLAKDPINRLAAECGVTLQWLPYTLDIPAYLGSARLGPDGKVVEESRNAHQWRRVRYSYMDCRRQARKVGLVIRGTQKIWNSVPAHIGMLWAQRAGDDVFHRYHDRVFERFWKRELDIEDQSVLEAVLAECGAPVAGFGDYLAGEGQAEHDRVRAEAEAKGVFGVPSILVPQDSGEDDLFWGREHLDDIRAMLRAG